MRDTASNLAPATAPAQSVVILTRGACLQLARLLRGLSRAEQIERSEVLLGVNGGDALAETRRLAERYLGAATLRVFSLARMHPGSARNELVREAAGDVLIFLDDDVEVPPDLLVRVHELMSDPRVDVVGGPNLTPPSSSRFEQLAGRVLASAVGTGPLRHRYGLGPAARGGDRSLILCNLAARRTRIAPRPFDAGLASAEENELLGRLERDGATLLYSPDVVVYHRRRGTLASHFRQMVKYGFGRGQLLVRAFSRAQVPFALPSLALLSLPALAVLQTWLFGLVVCTYLLVLAVASCRVARFRQFPSALALFASTHIGYGLGVLAGAVHELPGRFSRLGESATRRAGAARRAPSAS